MMQGWQWNGRRRHARFRRFRWDRLALVILSAALVRQFPGACFPFLRTLSKKWMAFLSGIFSFTPYTVWDIGFLMLILLFLFFLISTIVKRKSFRNFLSHVFLIISVIAFLANEGWMLNHYAPKL